MAIAPPPSGTRLRRVLVAPPTANLRKHGVVRLYARDREAHRHGAERARRRQASVHAGPVPKLKEPAWTRIQTPVPRAPVRGEPGWTQIQRAKPVKLPRAPTKAASLEDVAGQQMTNYSDIGRYRNTRVAALQEVLGQASGITPLVGAARKKQWASAAAQAALFTPVSEHSAR
jgi:hypothetical protein